MVDVGVLGNLKVLHDGPRSDDAVFEMLNTEAFEVLCPEMVEQFLACRLFGEHPIVEFKHTVFGAEVLFEVFFPVSVEQHFLW